MITFDEKTGLFHLKNSSMSYVMQVVRGKYLLHRYWGKAIREFRDRHAMQSIDRAFSPQPGDMRMSARSHWMCCRRNILPTATGLPHSAYEVRLANGTTITELLYEGYEIKEGKPKLAGLPAAYAEDHEAETAGYLAEGFVRGNWRRNSAIRFLLNFAIVARSAKMTKCGSEALDLTGAASFALDFSDHDFDRLSLYGGHAAERSLERVPLMRVYRKRAAAVAPAPISSRRSWHWRARMPAKRVGKSMASA